MSKSIYQKINNIKNKIGVIGKDTKNAQQNYKYRSIDDILNKSHQWFTQEEVIVIPSVKESETLKKQSGQKEAIYKFVTVEYQFVAAADGSSISVTVCGEGMDYSDKATNKAMTSALKNALNQLFLIPTKDTFIDSEVDTIQARTPAPLPQKKISKEQVSTLLHNLNDYATSKKLDYRKLYVHLCQELRISTLNDVTENQFLPLIRKFETSKQPA